MTQAIQPLPETRNDQRKSPLMTQADVQEGLASPSEETSHYELTSPKWGRSAKIIVVICMLIAGVFLIYRFTDFIQPLIISGLIAYLLLPLTQWISRHTRFARSTVLGFVYILFLLVMVVSVTVLGVVVFQQVQALIENLPRWIIIVSSLFEQLAQQGVKLGPFTIIEKTNIVDFDALSKQAIELLQPILTNSGEFIATFAQNTVAQLGWFVVVLFVSFYLAKDLPRFTAVLRKLARQPGYQYDMDKLFAEFNRIWNAYFRGQLTLCLVMGLYTFTTTSIVGVNYSFGLGVAAAFLEFIPYLGPTVTVVLTIIVAFSQESNYLGLDAYTLTGIVLVLGILGQQLENYILVPRIMSNALDLHPVVVFIGTLAAASTAGILGVLLCAPILATIKMLVLYIWRKLFDLDPFPERVVQQKPQTNTLQIILARVKSFFTKKQASEST
ncbi:MAG TPA: AI-2E family transporter [Anaerolineales bacterium]|nr:AI-2E family transporter [Anaerolineales bacterium]